MAIPDDSIDTDAQAMFGYDISLIAQSSFGATEHGKAIVALLERFNKAGHIRYAQLEERGAWDGENILVSDNYRARVWPTTCELAHEGAHALWRQRNPRKVQSAAEAELEEKAARIVQARVYQWLRRYRGAPVDPELEARLPKLGLR